MMLNRRRGSRLIVKREAGMWTLRCGHVIAAVDTRAPRKSAICPVCLASGNVSTESKRAAARAAQAPGPRGTAP
jgi:hypothetical protein